MDPLLSDPAIGGGPQAEVRPAVRGQGAPEKRGRERAAAVGRERRAEEEAETGKYVCDFDEIILGGKFELSFGSSQILEVNPKTSSEALAKELRQTRLTVDRLECEKKELEHKVVSAQEAER